MEQTSQTSQRRLLFIATSVFVAAISVFLEKIITTAMEKREAVLPITLCLVLWAVLHSGLRRWMVVTLCYGVGFMALRDVTSARQYPLPPIIDYLWVDTARPLGLFVVFLLAASAGYGETVRPNNIWTKRCYFGAAGIYFLGIGLLNWLWHFSWRGVALTGTGVIALLGCLFANQIADTEEDGEEEIPNDEILQQQRDSIHYRTLLAKEWHDPLSPLTSGTDKENSLKTS